MGARSVYQLNPISDADGICASQAPPSAGDLLINGALAVGGQVVFDTAHRVSITSDGNDAGNTFTIVGIDSRGITVTEQRTGPNVGTVFSVSYYTSIISISIDNASVGNITVGVNGEVVTPWFLVLQGEGPPNIEYWISLSAGATLTYDLEHTPDDVSDPNQTNPYLFQDKVIAGLISSDFGNQFFPSYASRVRLTAYTSGTLKVTAIRYDN